MKKVIAIIALLCIVLSLAACGKKANVEISNGETTQPTTGVDTTETTKPTEEVIPDETLPKEEVVIKDYWITITTSSSELVLTIDREIGEGITIQDGEITFAKGDIITEITKINDATFKGRLCSKVTENSEIDIYANNGTFGCTVQLEGKKYSVSGNTNNVRIKLGENAIAAFGVGEIETKIETKDNEMIASANIKERESLQISVNEENKAFVVATSATGLKLSINGKDIDVGNRKTCIVSMASGEPVIIETNSKK